MEQVKNELVAEMRQDPRMLTALFANHIDADKAYQWLIEKGYAHKDITLIMSEATRSTYFPNVVENTSVEIENLQGAEKGTVIGGSIGVTMGAIVGIALAIGSNLVIPGFGFLVAGPLFAGLAGAGTGAITGGLIGALTGVGFAEDRAQLYEASLKSGQIFIGVHAMNDDEKSIRLAWESMGAKEIHR